MNFLDDYENDPRDEALNEETLKQLIAEFDAATNEAVEKSNVINSEIAEDEREIAELRELVSRKVEARRKKEEERKRLREIARQKQVELQKYNRKLQTFLSEKALLEREASEKERIERVTIGAPWREWAFDHQLDGSTRLAIAKRAICGDKRGLGKTMQAGMYLDKVGAKKVVVIAPSDVLSNFEKELNRWCPDRKTKVIKGWNKQQRDMFLPMMADMPDFCLLINYEAWRRDMSIIDQMVDMKCDTVILDEAHFLKEGSTSAFRGVKKLVLDENACDSCGGKPETWTNPVTLVKTKRCSVCHKEPTEFFEFCSVKNVLPMTGTAIMNKPQDLWTLLHLVDPVAFDKMDSFLWDYCDQRYDGTGKLRWTFRYGGEERLIKKLGHRIVSRTPESAGVKMPEQEITHHNLERERGLYPDQWRILEQIENFMEFQLTANSTELETMPVTAAIAMYTRLRQCMTWPEGIKLKNPKTGEVIATADAHESIIMDWAEKMCIEIKEEEDKIVVFSAFKEALAELERRLINDGLSVARFDGSTKEPDRLLIKDAFDSKYVGQCTANNPTGKTFDVVLVNYKTGGVGLNLDAARQIVILDRPWNHASEDQAFGRVNRLITEHNSIVHIPHVEKTIMEVIDKIIQGKRNTSDGFEDQVNMTEVLIQALKNRES